MDNPLTLAKLLLPKVPLLLQTAASHTLGWSETSREWDLRSELIIKTIRAFINKDKLSTISKQQKLSLYDPGIKGKMWISKTTMTAPPEEDILLALEKAIEETAPAGLEVKYTRPPIASVSGEWTGFRPDADKKSPRLDISEEEQYKRLMKDVKSDVTTLYFHGGAFMLMDPATHRNTCSKFAHATGGRCFSVRYRLAPQFAFPTQVLDCLVAYLSLLYPPPGALHEPVPASKIVFAGESAGANLSLSLLQVILQLHRSSPNAVPTIRFHGKDVEIPLPAGAAISSPWTDLTTSFPSTKTNMKYDYLPALDYGRMSDIPKCDIWPTDPPRSDFYCEHEMILHPMISLLAAKDWKGCPPVQLTYGWELLADENRATAARLYDQGVKVEVWEYEAMPHCFAQVLIGSDVSQKTFDNWGGFMKKIVESPENVHASFTVVKSMSLAERKEDLSELRKFSDEVIDSMMKEGFDKKTALGANKRLAARL